MKRTLVCMFGLALCGGFAPAADPVEEPELLPAGDADPGWDRTRGTVMFQPAEAEYVAGGHFGRWVWPDFTPPRPGTFRAEVTYTAKLDRVGFQLALGEQTSKGYTPGTEGREHVAVLSPVRIDQAGPVPLKLLSSVDAEDSPLEVTKVALAPAPEGGKVAELEGGGLAFPADAATTWSETMHHSGDEGLTAWTDPEDWAGWVFEIWDEGTYTVEIEHRSATDDAELSVWIAGTELQFKPAKTDGWHTSVVGEVKIEPGAGYLLAVKPNELPEGTGFQLRRIAVKK